MGLPVLSGFYSVNNMYGEIFGKIPVMMHILEAYHIKLYVMNGISYE